MEVELAEAKRAVKEMTEVKLAELKLTEERPLPTIKGLKEVAMILGQDHPTLLAHQQPLQELQAILAQVCPPVAVEDLQAELKSAEAKPTKATPAPTSKSLKMITKTLGREHPAMVGRAKDLQEV